MNTSPVTTHNTTVTPNRPATLSSQQFKKYCLPYAHSEHANCDKKLHQGRHGVDSSFQNKQPYEQGEIYHEIPSSCDLGLKASGPIRNDSPPPSNQYETPAAHLKSSQQQKSVYSFLRFIARCVRRGLEGTNKFEELVEKYDIKASLEWLAYIQKRQSAKATVENINKFVSELSIVFSMFNSIDAYSFAVVRTKSSRRQLINGSDRNMPRISTRIKSEKKNPVPVRRYIKLVATQENGSTENLPPILDLMTQAIYLRVTQIFQIARWKRDNASEDYSQLQLNRRKEKMSTSRIVIPKKISVKPPRKDVMSSTSRLVTKQRNEHLQRIIAKTARNRKNQKAWRTNSLAPLVPKDKYNCHGKNLKLVPDFNDNITIKDVDVPKCLIPNQETISLQDLFSCFRDDKNIDNHDLLSSMVMRIEQEISSFHEAITFQTQGLTCGNVQSL